MPHFDPKLDRCPEDQATTRSFATDSGTGKTGESIENDGCVPQALNPVSTPLRAPW
jgi:hypothetical protein